MDGRSIHRGGCGGRRGDAGRPTRRRLAASCRGTTFGAAAALAFFAAGAFAQEPSPVVGGWKVETAWCLVPCLGAAKAHARSFTDAHVEIAADRLAAPMVKGCEGTVSVAFSQITTAEVLDRLRRAYGVEAPETARQAGLPDGTFPSGVATCQPAHGAPETLARFLEVETGRMAMLTPGGLVYELAPADGPAIERHGDGG